MKKVVLMVQFTDTPDGRTYADFDSLPYAIDGICQLYERGLKGLYPTRTNITYDLSDLFKYIDELSYISIFIRKVQGQYELHEEKDWIKREIFNHMNSQLT